MNSTISDAPLDPLTERELDILRLLAQGMSDREIGQATFLAPETVKWYNKQIYSKLGVHSRTQAVARAQALGVLEISRSRPDLDPPRRPITCPHRSRHLWVASVRDRGRQAAAGCPSARHPDRSPGTGKTRLAIELAQRIVSWYGDGVYFIDLMPIGQPEGLPTALAQALGIMETWVANRCGRHSSAC